MKKLLLLIQFVFLTVSLSYGQFVSCEIKSVCENDLLQNEELVTFFQKNTNGNAQDSWHALFLAKETENRVKNAALVDVSSYLKSSSKSVDDLGKEIIDAGGYLKWKGLAETGGDLVSTLKTKLPSLSDEVLNALKLDFPNGGLQKFIDNPSLVGSWKVLDDAKIDDILRTDIKQIESLSIYIEKVTKSGKDIASESLSSIISKQSNPKLYIESLSLNKSYGGIGVNNNLLEDVTIVNIKRKDPQFTGIDRFQSFDIKNINNKIVRFEGFNERGKQVWKQLSSKGDDQFSFVITKDKKLRLGYGHYNLSSMADEVISAGSVQMRNGKFSFISNGSGHYTPPLENLEGVIDVFKKMGLMTDDFKITKFKPKKN